MWLCARRAAVAYRGVCMSRVLWDAVTAGRLGSRVLAQPPPSAALEQLLQCRRSSDSARANLCTVLDERPTHTLNPSCSALPAAKAFPEPASKAHSRPVIPAQSASFDRP